MPVEPPGTTQSDEGLVAALASLDKHHHAHRLLLVQAGPNGLVLERRTGRSEIDIALETSRKLRLCCGRALRSVAVDVWAGPLTSRAPGSVGVRRRRCVCGLTSEVRRAQRHGAWAARSMMNKGVARPRCHTVAGRLDRGVRRHRSRPSGGEAAGSPLSSVRINSLESSSARIVPRTLNRACG